jgi:hypothetical protein
MDLLLSGFVERAKKLCIFSVRVRTRKMLRCLSETGDGQYAVDSLHPSFYSV